MLEVARPNELIAARLICANTLPGPDCVQKIGTAHGNVRYTRRPRYRFRTCALVESRKIQLRVGLLTSLKKSIYQYTFKMLKFAVI